MSSKVTSDLRLVDDETLDVFLALIDKYRAKVANREITYVTVMVEAAFAPEVTEHFVKHLPTGIIYLSFEFGEEGVVVMTS